ncbi:hypothetical protein [Dactylosporangium sp. CA-233914]|uniref:hypothetical protein n=1 Tax=Dactylosporangium sp. CA-233914 TaxID=3239934 RepID=UPI003D8F0ECD
MVQGVGGGCGALWAYGCGGFLFLLCGLREQVGEGRRRRGVFAAALRLVGQRGQIFDRDLAFRRVGLVGLGWRWFSVLSGGYGVRNLDRQLIFLGAEKAADTAGPDLFGRDDDSVGTVLVAHLREQFIEVTTLKQQPGRHRSPPQ